MPSIGKLISGFRVFKATTYSEQKEIIGHFITQGQKPSTMAICCVDSIISPSTMLATNPGELYIVNNIAGLVPKYAASGVHGIISAIEYGVITLEVENIIIMGHTKCDSIRMMMSDNFVNDGAISVAMKTWLSIASEAREAVKRDLGWKSFDEQANACEYEAILVSLQNLLTYPYISRRIEEGKLNIYGCYFDTDCGNISIFNPETEVFETIS